MTISRHDNQKALFVISAYTGAAVITSKGDAIHHELRDFSGMLDDHPIADELIKLTPGIYMWSGTLVIDDGHMSMGEPNDPDVQWHGKVEKLDDQSLISFHLRRSPSNHMIAR